MTSSLITYLLCTIYIQQWTLVLLLLLRRSEQRLKSNYGPAACKNILYFNLFWQLIISYNICRVHVTNFIQSGSLTGFFMKKLIKFKYSLTVNGTRQNNKWIHFMLSDSGELNMEHSHRVTNLKHFKSSSVNIWLMFTLLLKFHYCWLFLLSRMSSGFLLYRL